MLNGFILDKNIKAKPHITAWFSSAVLSENSSVVIALYTSHALFKQWVTTMVSSALSSANSDLTILQVSRIPSSGSSPSSLLSVTVN